jgi:hypothetical protein
MMCDGEVCPASAKHLEPCTTTTAACNASRAINPRYSSMSLRAGAPDARGLPPTSVHLKATDLAEEPQETGRCQPRT